jgi:hypothetical protein
MPNATKLHAALIIIPSLQPPSLSNTLIMGRRGPELSPQMRSRICKLRSLGWSYNRIKAKHPEIARTSIANTRRQEALRLDNKSQPRSGPPRVITDEQRDILYETVTTARSIRTKLYKLT